MSRVDEREYWVPEHVRDYLRGLGFTLPLEAMEQHERQMYPLRHPSQPSSGESESSTGSLSRSYKRRGTMESRNRHSVFTS